MSAWWGRWAYQVHGCGLKGQVLGGSTRKRKCPWASQNLKLFFSQRSVAFPQLLNRGAALYLLANYCCHESHPVGSGAWEDLCLFSRGGNVGPHIASTGHRGGGQSVLVDWMTEWLMSSFDTSRTALESLKHIIQFSLDRCLKWAFRIQKTHHAPDISKISS